MRVLLQLGAALPEDQGADPPLAVAIAGALGARGEVVARSREVGPDLAGYDLVHLVAAPPLERAVRQFAHARQAGVPVVVTPHDWPRPAGPEPPDHPARAHARALWALLLGGAEGAIAFAGAAPPVEVMGAALPAGAVADVRPDDPGLGTLLGEVYDRAVAARASVADGGQWLPGLPVVDYARRLESLVALQLAAIGSLHDEIATLRYQRDEAWAASGGGSGAGKQALQAEYDRLAAWADELAAQNMAQQAEYDRLSHWAGDLQHQLGAVREGSIGTRLAGRLRRATRR